MQQHIMIHSALIAVASAACATGATHRTPSPLPATASTAQPATAPPATDQPPAKLFVDAPVPEPLMRGVIILRYRADNLQIAPVFGPAAATVSPRLGHVHVTVNDHPWHWVDASGLLIVDGLAPGRHEILVELANPNHEVLDRQVVAVEVPARTAAAHH
jgi:hypothetical protein